jgi:hypothetical protein
MVRSPKPDATMSRRAFFRAAATAAASFLLGLVVDAAWARAVRGLKLQREQYPKLQIGRYRVHHNVVGYLFVLGGLFWHPLILIPIGLGMIVGHRMRDRLYWFIERVE